ncbi:putative phage abortive infection protein [Pedobacter sp.]
MITKLEQLNKKLEGKLNKETEHATLNKISNWHIYLLLALAAIAIGFAFYSPYFFTDKVEAKEFDTTTGQIGDTIGGLMNPYIALAGVIVTGLAFLMQYEANKQQRKLFLIEQEENTKQLQQQINRQDKERRIQQFESQFYEMIRLHRENVSEMEISGYDFEEQPGGKQPMTKFYTVTKGRKVFVTMKTELEAIITGYKVLHTLDSTGYERCYDLFFSGWDQYQKKYSKSAEFERHIRLASLTHQSPHTFKIYKNYERKDRMVGLKLNFNYKPFSGHASRLGHYFRHLYLTVKLVVNSEALKNDNQKIHYLRILRAQLSNHEQILLFYNWLSGHGKTWENGSQHFFTKYNMIHNLWYNELIKDPFIDAKVDEIRKIAKSFGNNDVYEID